MKVRAELLVTCAALAITAGLASPALAGDLITKAPVAVAPQWWYEGYAEIGVRFNIQSSGKDTLGKFYEYRDLRPGVFGNFFYGAHKTGADPLDIEAWGENIGWNDQAFGLDISKPGAYYLTFGWDETPHDYWQNAKTMYSGVGTNNLTIGTFLTPPPTAATNATILANSHTIDLGFRRDTASAKARWTPDDAWDFNFDYTHLHREGTQGLGAVSFSNAAAGTRSAFELPKPIDDTTHNANLSGEYVGTTPWSTPFNVRLGGGFSSYQDSFNALNFQNPWNAVNSPLAPLNNQYSLPPDNQAGSVNLQGGVGLPFRTRYMGTFQFSRMTADASGLPFSVNPFVLALPTGTISTPDRKTDTMLFNNVFHTQITDELKSTLKYRYYNYNADDLPAQFLSPRPPNPDSTSGFPDDETAFRHPSSYTKQNVDAQLGYHPWKWLNVGASYDWENWHRTWREVDTTNEHTGKIFADARVGGFSTLRGNLQYGQRRFDHYTALEDDANIAQFRMNDIANRDRTKGQFSWEVDVTHEITVTPNGGFVYDDYKTDIQFFAPGEIGLKKATSWNAGIDAAFMMSRGVAFFASYNFDNGYRQVFENAATPLADVNTRDLDHTFMLGGKFAIVPEKLFLTTSYTYIMSTSKWNLGCTPAGCQYTPLAVYPDVHNNLSRLDVQAKYLLDDTILHNAGLPGKAYVKARIMWERNTNDSWQDLQNQFGFLVNPTVSTTGYSIWMGTGNPNYNVVLGQLSMGVKW